MASRAVLITLLFAGCADSGARGATDASSNTTTDGSTGSETGSSGTTGPSPTVPLEAAGIAIAARHTCALLLDGAVACWGRGGFGALGDGDTEAHFAPYPRRVPGLEGATKISAGGFTTCAILEDGTIRCWGAGQYGNLGNGTAENDYWEPSPVEVSGINNAVDISVAWSMACAVLADGGVSCWGRNHGEFGFASGGCGPYYEEFEGLGSWQAEPCESVPVALRGIQGATAVSIGDGVCVRHEDGSGTCIGDDSLVVMGASELAGVSAIDIGQNHACALVDSAVYCWGKNWQGVLGDPGVEEESVTPIPTLQSANVADLVVYSNGNCAVLHSGSVNCWGGVSRLFEDETENLGVPTALPGLDGVVELTLSSNTACGRRSDNVVTCWGATDNGDNTYDPLTEHDYSYAPILWFG